MFSTDIAAGQLPASKTHAERRWTFLPSADATQLGLGTLSIVQGRRDMDSYAIDVADIGKGCCEVLFVKKDNTGEVYAVTCNRVGSPVACTCPGHFFGRKKGIVCKHATATKELLADGVIALPNGFAATAA